MPYNPYALNNGGDAMTYTKDSPLILSTTGTATIPRKAERAVLHVVVATSGQNKQWASGQVTSTAKELRKMFESMSPANDTEEAKSEAILAHWNMTRLSSTSHQPAGSDGRIDEKAPPIFDVSLSFNIRVRKFSALGPLASKLSSMAHVSLNNIEWVLTADTQKSYETELRKMASFNALEQARDYGAPLGITSFRPVSIEPQGEMVATTQRNAGMFGRTQQTARKARGGGLFGGGGPSSMFASVQQAPAPPGSTLPDTEDDLESDLAFFPEDVNMTVSVDIKFIGEGKSVQ